MPPSSDSAIDCEDCVMPMHHGEEPEAAAGFMKCVTCPFCKQTVTAVVTPEQIKCPECEMTVKR